VGEDRAGPTGTDRRRLTVPQAAEALGVTVDAVRGRIRRGKLVAEHDSGAVYVWIDAPEENDGPQQSATSQRPSSDQAERIEDLREQVAYLREQLEQANERDRENRRIIAALTSRIPAIEAPASPEARESPETAEEQQGRGQPRPDTPGAQEATQPRPWWRRMFGT
jgi:predicted RNase H-like nuclease (RuvC/YqgF family)